MKVKLLVSLFCIPLLVLSVTGLWFSNTQGFKICKISSGAIWSSSWAKNFSFLTAEEQNEVKEILNQPYFYLARGQQAYAFVSEDQKYVIKFLRLPKYHAPFWSSISFLPKYLIEKGKIMAAERKKALLSYKNSIELAQKHLKESSALIYCHLNQSSDLQKSLTVFDPLGISHSLNLDSYSFVIQRKTELIGPFLKKLRNKFDVEGIENTISAFISTVKIRSQKKIRNKNRNCMKNLGVLDGRVVEFDVGELRMNPDLNDPKVFAIELEKSTRQLKKWLTENLPEGIPILEKAISRAKEE